MSIGKDDAVEISPVGNGFLVRKPYNMSRGDCVPLAEMLVFRTMAELQAFLAEHFTWRAKVALNDTAQTIKVEKRAA